MASEQSAQAMVAREKPRIVNVTTASSRRSSSGRAIATSRRNNRIRKEKEREADERTALQEIVPIVEPRSDSQKDMRASLGALSKLLLKWKITHEGEMRMLVWAADIRLDGQHLGKLSEKQLKLLLNPTGLLATGVLGERILLFSGLDIDGKARVSAELLLSATYAMAGKTDAGKEPQAPLPELPVFIATEINSKYRWDGHAQKKLIREWIEARASLHLSIWKACQADDNRPWREGRDLSSILPKTEDIHEFADGRGIAKLTESEFLTCILCWKLANDITEVEEHDGPLAKQILASNGLWSSSMEIVRYIALQFSNTEPPAARSTRFCELALAAFSGLQIEHEQFQKKLKKALWQIENVQL